MIIVFLIILVFTLSAEIIHDVFKSVMLSPSFSMPKNIFINHSVSFMSGISSDNQSFYQSVYTNHINYRLSPKLELKLDLNFVNFGSASFENYQFDSNDDNQTKILPNFQLNYQPTKNMKIQIEFNKYSNYTNRNWGY